MAKVGRPTKYNQEILDKTKDYIVNYKSKYNDEFPSVAGLACELGIRRETLHVWAKEEGKEEFSNMLGQLSETQERKLLNCGVNGEFNAAITKLVLAKHDYSDKIENTGDFTVNLGNKDADTL